MLFRLLLLVMGIGFLDETFGSIYDNQDNIQSITENRRIPQTKSESSAETKKNKIAPEFFDGRQKPMEANHPATSSENRLFHSGAEIFGSSGSTLTIPERLGKRTFRREPTKFRRLERPKVSLDSPSTPIFGKYKTLSRDRSRYQLKRWSLIRKSEKVNVNPVEVDRRRIRDSVGEINSRRGIVKKISPIDEIIKNWSASKRDEEESKNEEIKREVRTESLSDNGLSTIRLISEETQKKQVNPDVAETSQTLPKIARLLESVTGGNAGSCQVVFKTLLALMTNEKIKENIDLKTKRSLKKLANETPKMADEAQKVVDEAEKMADEAEKIAEETKKLADETKKMANKTKQALVSTKKSNMTSKNRSISTISIADDTKKLAEDTKNMAAEAKKISDETKNLAEETKQTLVSTPRSNMTHKNFSVSTIPMANETKKLAEETKQTPVSIKKSNMTLKNLSMSTISIADETKKLVEDSKNMGEEDKKMTDETKKLAEETKQTLVSTPRSNMTSKKQSMSTISITETKKLVEDSKNMGEEDKKITDGTKKLAEETKQTLVSTPRSNMTSKKQSMSTISITETKKLVEDSKNMVEEAKKMSDDTKKIARETKELAEEIKQTPVSIQKSNMTSKNLSMSTISMTDETKKLVEDTKNMVEEAKKMSDDTKKIVRETKKLAEETKKLAEETKQTPVSIQKSNMTSKKNSMSTISIADGTKKLVEDTKNMAEEAKKMSDDTKKIARETKQLVEEAKKTPVLIQKSNMTSIKHSMSTISITDKTKKLVEDTKNMAEDAKEMSDDTKKMPNVTKKMSDDTKKMPTVTKKMSDVTKKMETETKKLTQESKQTLVSTPRSNMTSKNLSASTISFTTNTTMSPTKSSFLNITKSSSVKTKNLTKSSSVTTAKNVSVKFSTVTKFTVKSTKMTKLKEQSTSATDKFISTKASPSTKTTSSGHNKSNPNSASTKSRGIPHSENIQKTSEDDSALSFISLLLRHLGTELRTEKDSMSSKNETRLKSKVASSVTKLVDYVSSFMKLSYSVVQALINKIDLKADLVDKRTTNKRFSAEVSVVKDIFSKLLSDILSPTGSGTVRYNISTSQNNQSQSRERILLTNEIAERLNGGRVPVANYQNDAAMPDFRSLISLARSDKKYVKYWSDGVLTFLSKQSHHFMSSGIYERLSSFWPRSSITAESWTLRLAGYCAQIEIDENMAVVDSSPLFCPFKNSECDINAKYRDQSGICNNLDNPLWGSANIPFRRQLKNAYADGVSKPRIFDQDGVPLPNAKLISQSVFEKNDEKTAEHINLFTVFFTQFVSHDITRFAMDIGDIGPVKVNCCLSDTINRSECFPIFVKEEKQPTGSGSDRCLHFLRSMPTVPLGCQSHVREQINQVTSFLDASNVYGSSLKEIKELRLFQRGLMKITLCGPESLPPTDRNGASECGLNADQRQFPCFYAGDPRVNENPALALVHVLWLREHNRIARRLGEINPHWDDTKLFEETRKIVSAMMQHVVYNELLPLIIGFKKAKEFGLLSEIGFFNDYEPKTDPTLENGVAAAAFRFGHGMISDRFLFLAGCPSAHSKCSPQSILNGPYDQETNMASDPLIAPPMCPYTTQKNVSAMFENVDVFHHSETELESLLRGLLMQSAEVATDTMLSPAITEKLFGHMDLMARNVQRGRDHGLPSYNKWREWCGLPVARNFNSDEAGFTDHKIKVVDRFAQVYNNPEDVDLIIGGLTESPIDGALLGPTFVCMIGRQFKQLKFGDRFWYENEGQFTQDQLREIRMMKVSHILLNNAGIQSVPKFAFGKGSNDNPFITSLDQVQLELSFWKEEKQNK